MKKPIKCPDCGFICAEVKTDQEGFHHYPKPICEPNVRRTYNEYRYYCSKCKKEWVQNTLFNEIAEVPFNSQYTYDEREGCLVPNPSCDY